MKVPRTVFKLVENFSKKHSVTPVYNPISSVISLTCSPRLIEELNADLSAISRGRWVAQSSFITTQQDLRELESESLLPEVIKPGSPLDKLFPWEYDALMGVLVAFPDASEEQVMSWREIWRCEKIQLGTIYHNNTAYAIAHARELQRRQRPNYPYKIASFHPEQYINDSRLETLTDASKVY